MTTSTNEMVLAAVMEALALMQDQLGAIHDRLDAIDSAQASVTDFEPMLETLLARVIDHQASAQKGMETISRVAAFAHAAASGSPAALPSDLLSDPLLDRFRREMPADRLSPERALARWREEVAKATTPDLAAALIRQYEPSATETVDSVALRYRMAAISREELQRRLVDAPEHSAGPVERNASAAARSKRAQDLATLWRGGPSLRLYGEAELAGVVDVLEQLEATQGIERETVEGMRQKIGEHLASGQRLSPRRAAPFGDGDHSMGPDGLVR